MGQLIGQPSQKAGFVRPLLGGLRQVRVLRTRMFTAVIQGAFAADGLSQNLAIDAIWCGFTDKKQPLIRSSYRSVPDNE